MSWVKNGIRDNDVVILDTRGRIDSFWCHKKFSELAEETICWSRREAGYLFQQNDKRVISCLLHCSHAVASRGACLCFIRWSTRCFADLICHGVIRGSPEVGLGKLACRTSQLVRQLVHGRRPGEITWFIFDDINRLDSTLACERPHVCRYVL